MAEAGAEGVAEGAHCEKRTALVSLRRCENHTTSANRSPSIVKCHCACE